MNRRREWTWILVIAAVAFVITGSLNGFNLTGDIRIEEQEAYYEFPFWKGFFILSGILLAVNFALAALQISATKHPSLKKLSLLFMLFPAVGTLISGGMVIFALTQTSSATANQLAPPMILLLMLVLGMFGMRARAIWKYQYPV